MRMYILKRAPATNADLILTDMRFSISNPESQKPISRNATAQNPS